MVKATARVSAVELKGFRSVQTLAKVELSNASLTGIVGPNGEYSLPHVLMHRAVSRHTLTDAEYRQVPALLYPLMLFKMLFKLLVPCMNF